VWEINHTFYQEKTNKQIAFYLLRIAVLLLQKRIIGYRWAYLVMVECTYNQEHLGQVPLNSRGYIGLSGQVKSAKIILKILTGKGGEPVPR